MTKDELAILDLSRVRQGEWTPPIGAMGGPPAHELYHDLVTHAGLKLFRDESGDPWVEIQDGERRRGFLVPSPDLRAALDRFRMRRNLRPVPASDIDEFTRVVEARISDPDVQIPLGGPTLAGRGTPPPAVPGTIPGGNPETEGRSWAVDELDHLMREVDAIQGRVPLPSENEVGPAKGPSGPPSPVHRRIPYRWQTGVSGARGIRTTTDPRLPRYVRVLRELVQDGTWIGSLSEIARRTGDDTNEVFSALLQFHTDLVGNDLVVAPVEVEDGWRWVVVDRTRLRPSVAGAQATPVAPAASSGGLRGRA